MHDRWELSGESEKILKVLNANDIHKKQYQRWKIPLMGSSTDRLDIAEN